MLANIEIPVQGYNLISIFVCVLLVLWIVRALRRFYRALLLRTAATSRNLILLRGLGNNLTFFEGATQMHMDALVHTRQSKPPTRMQTLYIPFAIKGITARNGEGFFSYEVDIWLASKSTILFLWNFRPGAFKGKFDGNFKRFLIGRSNGSNSRIISLFEANDINVSFVSLN